MERSDDVAATLEPTQTRGNAKWRPLLVVGGVCLCWVIFFGGIASASSSQASTSTTTTTSPLPSLALVGPTSETVQMVLLNHSKIYEGTITLLIQNTGPQASKAQIRVFSDPTVAGGKLTITKPTGTISIPGYADSKQTVTFKDTNAQNNDATVTFGIEVLAPKKVPPTVEAFKLLRQPSVNDFWVPIWGGLIFGLAFLVARSLSWTIRHKKIRGTSIYPPASWTFGGSWVTLISVLGAVLATILATSGLITDVFPSIDVQRFVALNLVLGGAVLTGPLIYAAMSKTEGDGKVINGRASGLLWAASVTLIGVAGQLLTLGVLAHISSAQSHEKAGIYVALGIVGAILFLYSYRSLGQLRGLVEPDPASTGGGSTSKSFMTGI
jgi:hypothetical protein